MSRVSSLFDAWSSEKRVTDPLNKVCIHQSSKIELFAKLLDLVYRHSPIQFKLVSKLGFLNPFR